MTEVPASTTSNAIPEQLLRPAQAARVLGVTPHCLERWRRENRGPAFVRVGRLARYQPSAIAAYISSQTCGGGAGGGEAASA